MYRTNSEETSDGGVRLYSENKVIFRAGEDLYHNEQSKGKEVVLKRGKSVKFDYDAERTFNSYCCEFWGKINLKLNTLNFVLKNHRVAMHRNVKRPCEISVYMSTDASSDTNKFLSALMNLFQEGEHSDLTIKIGSSAEFKVHKCVLAARSPKLKVMLLNNMKESITNLLVIENQGKDFAELFKHMLTWIYTEKWDFPESITSMIDLLCLTDEYMLSDLQTVCELEVMKRLNADNVVKILTDEKIMLPPSSEDNIKEAAKEVLISEFPIILENNPNIEKEISKVEGLWSSLLLKATQINDCKNNRRRLSIMGEKRVRFKISNHIYAPSLEGENDEEDLEEEIDN